jgi:methyl-accepting chemotaxis protein
MSMNELFDMAENTQRTSHQTRLLVLDTLFEAARAGEAGKELAIRADELKKLTVQETAGEK